MNWERKLPLSDSDWKESYARCKGFGKNEPVSNQFHIPLNQHFVQEENKTFVLFREPIFGLTLDKDYPNYDTMPSINTFHTLPAQHSNSVQQTHSMSTIKKVAAASQSNPTQPSPPVVDNKIEKQRKRAVIQKWTAEEDSLLLDAIQKYGTKNWITIANAVKTKTKEQCHQHYHRVMNPVLNKTPWTDEEDTKLLGLVQRYGTSAWKQISTSLDSTRSDTKCRERYFMLMKKVDSPI